MLTALRIGRHPIFLQPAPLTIASRSSSHQRTVAARLCSAAQSDVMESKTPEQDAKNTDPIAESFGTVYATRCDEEGFGGINGGNQMLPKEEEDGAVGEVRSGYDESQREVKEKEKRRNEEKATSTT